jgi:DNA-binding NtrC family response regulator
MPATKRVLIVDDEEKILFVMRHALARLDAHCQVQTARDGRQALEMARDASFDLVVTDLRMPEMDGIELTRSLRKLDGNPVVIWMTAYGGCAQAAEMERLRVHCCLDKPIEIGDMRRIVSEVLWPADLDRGV